MSVDRVVLDVAEELLPPAEFARRFETWLPAPALEKEPTVRFRKGTVRELHGTPHARRYKVVQQSSGLITIGGKAHTRSILELALAVGKPALPVPFTGEQSESMWRQNSNEFLLGLRSDAATLAPLEEMPTSREALQAAAILAVDSLLRAVERRCLVLMPFDIAHDAFYSDALAPAIRREDFVPYRIDHDEQAGDIPKLFGQAAEDCDAIVVDLTGSNPNVLYELGWLHSRERSAMLLLRYEADVSAQPELPFYLLHEKILKVPSTEAGHAQAQTEVSRQYCPIKDLSRVIPHQS